MPRARPDDTGVTTPLIGQGGGFQDLAAHSSALWKPVIRSAVQRVARHSRQTSANAPAVQPPFQMVPAPPPAVR